MSLQNRIRQTLHTSVLSGADSPESSSEHLAAVAHYMRWHVVLVALLSMAACGSGAPIASSAKTSGGNPVAVQPQVTLASNPTSIVSGQTAMLTWSSTNATSCTASNGWSGSEPTSGSQSTPALTASTKFTLTCAGAGGSAAQSATVSVSAQQSAPPPPPPQPTVTLSASPTSISNGGSSTLTWSSTGATSCIASGGWSGTEAISGSQSTGALTATTTYILTCTGAGGSTAQSATVAMMPSDAACTATSGPLTLNAKVSRSSGISPLLVFFDATGTTDSSIKANTTTFQDVTYSWNFSDPGSSGTGTWAYGSSPGKNSMNTATGGVAAHVYVTNGGDTSYNATVTATDGANTASCTLGVTAYDPSGSNGFPGSATACVAASTMPVAGSGGCPPGAATLQQSNFATALKSLGSGKRVLFNCGDTFTGSGYTISATKASIGAYGSCVGTTNNRPILRATSNPDGLMNIGVSSGDIRVADIAFDGNNQSGIAIFDTAEGGSLNSNHPYQYTLLNLDAKNQAYSYRWGGGAQMGIIGSTAQVVQTNSSYINVFPNYAGTGVWTSNGTVPNEDYQAVMGDWFTDGASGNNEYETMRNAYASKAVISNTTFLDAGPGYAVLKLQNGTYGCNGACWGGIYTENVEISDNYFGGSSGANLVEIAPMNSNTDERLRNIVIERNIFAGTSGAVASGRQMQISGVNITARDNVFNGAASGGGGGFGVQIAQRGIEPIPQYVEIYNNTCYGGGSVDCVGFSATGNVAAGINSWAMNNMGYQMGAAVQNGGSGNTVSNNATVSNPGFTNASGNYSLISDFKPTANYLGGTSVPVYYDALGVAWPPTWDLGALHH